MPPIPLLLDTFTAADGTDPTSRDLDIIPAAFSGERWVSTLPIGSFGPGTQTFLANAETFQATDFPVIRSGRLCAVEHFLQSGARFYSQAFAYIGEGLGREFFTSWPAAIYIEALAVSSTDGEGLIGDLYDENGQAYVSAALRRTSTGCVVTGSFYDQTNAGLDFNEYPVTEGALHKIVVHFQSTGATLICNGVVFESLSTAFQQSPLNVLGLDIKKRGAVLHTSPSVTQADEGISAVALYQNITLEQAIALTA